MNMQELIRAAKGTRSYLDLERDCSGKLKAARWQQIATRPLRAFPDPLSLAAIAQALRVPNRTVILAAANSLGLDTAVPDNRLTELLPPAVDELNERSIAAVLTVVDALINGNRAAG